MNNVDLKQYLPDCYKDIVEQETLQDSLSLEVNKLHSRYELALNDQFIQLCSIKAISYYENIFHISSDPQTESLQFRRDRVLTRMRILRPPYTYYYLRNVFDDFFGVDNYNLTIDNDNYIIKLKSAVEDSLWYHEIQVTMTAVKPCNMTFINNPQVTKTLNVNETILTSQSVWNYKLDGSWQLGLRPFYSSDISADWNYKLDGTWKLGEKTFVDSTRNIIKMPNTHSLEQPLFDFTLNEYKNKFYKVLLNDSLEIIIEDFNKTVESDSLNLSYTVTSSQFTVVTNIKLLDSQDNILENANVYVPIVDTVEMLHIIKLKEIINE